jgi:hypothetical protein
MRFRIMFLGCVLLIAGCGSSPVPVTGQVKLNGKPLADADVAFIPDKETAAAGAGAGSVGKTDANGNFTLRMAQKDVPGAIPGKYTVKISLTKGGGGEQSSANPKAAEQLLPAEYNDQTKLTFEVPSGGTSSANFNLEKIESNAK